MSKYWHRTPHWIKSIQMFHLCTYSLLMSRAKSSSFFLNGQIFYFHFISSVLFGRGHLNCNHLSADADCCWLLLVPMFPFLNVHAGIKQDLVRPRFKSGQKVEKLTSALACCMSLLVVPKWVSLPSNATVGLRSLFVTGCDWRHVINENRI